MLSWNLSLEWEWWGALAGPPISFQQAARTWICTTAELGEPGGLLWHGAAVKNIHWWIPQCMVESDLFWHVEVLSYCRYWRVMISRCISQFSHHFSHHVISLICTGYFFAMEQESVSWKWLSQSFSTHSKMPFSWSVLCVDLGSSIWPWRSSADSSPAGAELWLGCWCIACYLKLTLTAVEIVIMQYYLQECICPFYVNSELFSKSISFL